VPDAQADSDASPKILLQVNVCLKPDVCGYLLRVFVVYARAMFPGNVHEVLMRLSVTVLVGLSLFLPGCLSFSLSLVCVCVRALFVCEGTIGTSSDQGKCFENRSHIPVHHPYPGNPAPRPSHALQKIKHRNFFFLVTVNSKAGLLLFSN
jgi:hypothetical protein